MIPEAARFVLVRLPRYLIERIYNRSIFPRLYRSQKGSYLKLSSSSLLVPQVGKVDKVYIYIYYKPVYQTIPKHNFLLFPSCLRRFLLREFCFGG